MLLLEKIFTELPLDEAGATEVEYAILVALLAIISIVITTDMGEAVSTTFSIISSSLAGVNN